MPDRMIWHDSELSEQQNLWVAMTYTRYLVVSQITQYLPYLPYIQVHMLKNVRRY